MSNRKMLLLPLLVLMVGVAVLIFTVLQAGEGDVSLSGVLGRDTAGPEPAGLSLLADAEAAAPSGLQDVAGEVAEAGAAPSSLAGPQPVRGTVSGRLVDEAGAAVAGESVWLALEEDDWETEPREQRLQPVVSRAVADAEGAFTLPARAGVEYTLRAGGTRHPVTQLSAVHAGDRLMLTLQRATALAGVVLDEATGQPVPGARVLALHGDTTLVGEAAGDGTFRLGPLPSQDVLAGAWAPGYDATLVGNIAPEAESLTLELSPGRLLSGRLLDAVTELPLAGGEVKLVIDVDAARAGGDPLPLTLLVQERTAVVGEDGRFEFEGAPSIGFTLLCTSQGYLPESFDRYRDRMLEPDDQVMVSLTPADAVTGEVRIASSGLPATGAELWLSAPAAVLAHGSTDAGGDFALQPRDLPVELLLSQPTHVTARLGELSARDRVGREREGLLLQLVPVLPLAVQVVDGGTPVAGAEVAARSKGAEVSQVVTDAQGLCSLEHAPAGPDVDRVVLQARHGDLESLPLVLDPADLPSDTVTLDLSAGAWVAGSIVDETGAPVPSAQVRARPTQRDSGDPSRSGYSDAEGHFRVGPLPPGVEYLVVVQADGYLDQDLPSVYAGGSELLITLAPVLRWRGRALDATTGLAMQDFWGQLRLETVEDGRARQRNTNERLHLQSGVPGEFWFELPGPGRYVLRLSARDYVTASSLPFDFDGRTAPPFTDMRMSQAAVLEVTVLDGRGRPVPGYAVAAAPWEKARDATVPAGDLRKQSANGRTDEDGLVRLNLGAGGIYRVAGGPGLWFDDLSVVVAPGLPVSRLYHLPPTGDLEVAVRDEEGRPLGGAMVEVRSSRDEQVHLVSRRARSGADEGLVMLETLPPGDYDVSARRRNFEVSRGTVMVRANALERITLTLKPREQSPSPTGSSGTDGPLIPGPPR